MEDNIINKKALRKTFKKLRNDIPDYIRMRQDEYIKERLLNDDNYISANVLMSFINFGSEVNTGAIINDALNAGKKVCLPRVMDIKNHEMRFFTIDSLDDLKISSYGIKEPAADFSKLYIPDENDKIFMIMPGLAFDIEGHRLGYGGGFYDSYLKEYGNFINTKAAVCYLEQMSEEPLPSDPHDIKPDYIIVPGSL
ncbi:MAG: 5-formyltetrahydrofolate cyclo-ligase [Lachnospiraceae bacterium]|jgi:5-formyltetrahydrofolate cyclo-ligase|nr:5-formyltetrahydrofolate cyclo-ligase [Lachnospiraceae bacterium]